MWHRLNFGIKRVILYWILSYCEGPVYVIEIRAKTPSNMLVVIRDTYFLRAFAKSYFVVRDTS